MIYSTSPSNLEWMRRGQDQRQLGNYINAVLRPNYSDWVERQAVKLIGAKGKKRVEETWRYAG